MRLRTRLEYDIIEGVFAPGDRLDEVLLAAHYGVSRTPVREVLRMLAAAGLVDLRPRNGASVASLSADEVVDLFEVVAELEGLSARLAAERLKVSDRNTLIEAHDACVTAAVGDSPRVYFAANLVFHEAIQAAARNLTLAQQIEALNKRLMPLRRSVTFLPGRTVDALREHEAILAAILAGHGEPAHSAMRDHVRVLGSDIVALAKGLRQ